MKKEVLYIVPFGNHDISVGPLPESDGQRFTWEQMRERAAKINVTIFQLMWRSLGVRV